MPTGFQCDAFQQNAYQNVCEEEPRGRFLRRGRTKIWPEEVKREEAVADKLQDELREAQAQTKHLNAQIELARARQAEGRKYVRRLERLVRQRDNLLEDVARIRAEMDAARKRAAALARAWRRVKIEEEEADIEIISLIVTKFYD